MKYRFLILFLILAAESFAQKPNVVLIYADDLGYGDLSCYGAKAIKTPNIDKLAKQGMKFTRGYSTSATCTPSRYSLLTGRYAFRRNDTGIAPGNASALIKGGQQSVATVFGKAGYQSAVVGKWHLGLGGAEGPNWNGKISNGPLDIGFNYAFLIPATGDRVPCVYVENDRVVNLDPKDPIEVNYVNKIGQWPTGKDNPELLRMKHSDGHDNTIVNGIGRIGYMTGGTSALWKDEDIAQRITDKAKEFISKNSQNPFFLFFSTHDIHVPRVPNSRFLGKSGLGNRGDAILQFDDSVGQLMKLLDSLQLSSNTMVILTSDNGPVVDDGYHDGSKENIGKHKPAAGLRGGKYSAFEAGTRVPFIVRHPSVKADESSSALVSQVDFLATMAGLTNQKYDVASASDSQNQLKTWLGSDTKGRTHVIEQSGTLSIVQGNWKYIKPNKGPAYNPKIDIEYGNDEAEQLYDLSRDPFERYNLATSVPAKLSELKSLLQNELLKK
ncbi:arylsulfatase [Daejeonella sp.]|uniref:sulfatase family protein n=1 Tax=Daejeonella sp. TaxID=2805397 RepID=UPI0027308EA2|nr:arylsulfatase [Daejeonella sp.]MDP2413058.1 arylsulfatase [Daejeonella sp.]